MTIEYHPASIAETVSDLDQYGSLMKRQIEKLHGAANAFRDRLSGDRAIASFDAAHKKPTPGPDGTLVTLDHLGVKVENALNRAIEAEGKVGDGSPVSEHVRDVRPAGSVPRSGRSFGCTVSAGLPMDE